MGRFLSIRFKNERQSSFWNAWRSRREGWKRRRRRGRRRKGFRRWIRIKISISSIFWWG
jgi:hypothetical protein